MEIHFLKADNGDSILMSWEYMGVPKNVLIDGGVSSTYLISKNRKGKEEAGELKKVIERIKNKKQKIDLLIMSHVDDDHIGGILRWFQKDVKAFEYVDKVWFNSGKLIAEYFKKEHAEEDKIVLNIATNTNTSIGQGITFENYLKQHDIWERTLIHSGLQFERFGMLFTILSPNKSKLEALLKKWKKEKPDYKTSGKEDDYHLSIKAHIAQDKFKEDKTAHNGSSIAFMISYNNKNWLFLADAHPSVIIASLKELGYSKDKPLLADLVKISHHGSKLNSNRELLQMVRANSYVVSTNGKKHNHPNKQMLSRLIDIHPDCKIYFNYGERIDAIFSGEDFNDFPQFEARAITDNFCYFDDN